MKFFAVLALIFVIQCVSFAKADSSVGGVSASDGGRVGGSLLNAIAVGGSAANNGGSANSGNAAGLLDVTVGNAEGAGGLTEVHKNNGLF